MAFLQKILAGLVSDLLGKFAQWVYEYIEEQQRIKKEKDKNAEAVKKVKESKTDEEIDDALDAITDRTDKY